jgi:hypothetical protein
VAKGFGLERYVPPFRDNEIDWEVLPKLTSEDLREMVEQRPSRVEISCRPMSPFVKRGDASGPVRL